MRLDKYLKVSRIIKRRTVAAKACGDGHVLANGKAAAASYQVKVGDILTVCYGSRRTSFKVLELCETCLKEDASAMYEVV